MASENPHRGSTLDSLLQETGEAEEVREMVRAKQAAAGGRSAVMKTVRVPVMIYPDGHVYVSHDGSYLTPEESASMMVRLDELRQAKLYWLTAELPIPEPAQEVEAEVSHE